MKRVRAQLRVDLWGHWTLTGDGYCLAGYEARLIDGNRPRCQWRFMKTIPQPESQAILWAARLASLLGQRTVPFYGTRRKRPFVRHGVRFEPQ